MTRAKFICHTPEEGKIYLPNEIFQDFTKVLEKHNHASFAYSFYYAINYFYRYNKYVQVPNITTGVIKEFLGYVKTNKTIDYIVRQHGVLENIGYIKSTTDYPVFVELDERNRPDFQLMSEVKKMYPELSAINQRNFRIRIPVKAFYRNQMAMNNDYQNGTFYEGSNTHGIKISRFLEMMDNAKLSTIGFFIYGYLKHCIDTSWEGWYAISQEELARTLNVSKTTIVKYTKELENAHFINIRHQKFMQNQDGEANVYRLV